VVSRRDVKLPPFIIFKGNPSGRIIPEFTNPTKNYPYILSKKMYSLTQQKSFEVAPGVKALYYSWG
jgi:hypothetical protein